MKELGDSACAFDNIEGDDEEEAFEMLVEQASDAGYSLVFFLDEFESVTQNQNFDEQFFGRLRYIANMYNVAFITSSQKDLSTLCHTDVIAQSPFFNIFTKVDLQLLKEKEALALIREPAKAHGVHFVDQEIELVFELAGRHPFFIQIACSHLFELKRSRGQAILSGADFDYIREKSLKETADHFDYYLRHLDDKERSALYAIATSPSFDPAASGMVSEAVTLQRMGLVVHQSGHFSPFCHSFRKFSQSLSAKGDYDGSVRHAIVQDLAEPLSERELEVLRLVAPGLTNLEIAVELCISVNTVKTHLQHIFDKLDAKNRLEAVDRARDLGLI